MLRELHRFTIASRRVETLAPVAASNFVSVAGSGWRCSRDLELKPTRERSLQTPFRNNANMMKG